MISNEKDPAQERRQYITFLATGQEFAADIMTLREIRGWRLLKTWTSLK